MMGTFRPGDKLCIEKISLNQVKKGDAIIFSSINKGENDFVVHRVMNKCPGGLATRGDNNISLDKGLVTEENIIGKVTHYERNGKIHKAWSSRRGMLWAGALYARLHITKIVKFFFRKPYLMIRKTGIVAKFWRPKIEIIHFETSDGPLTKYIHKGRTVALCWTKENRWRYQRPYDFIIEPKQ